jgi:hypothetical protein
MDKFWISLAEVLNLEEMIQLRSEFADEKVSLNPYITQYNSLKIE